MDDKINDKIKLIIDYCNDNNVPMRNLNSYNFLSPEIEKLWDELEKNSDIDTFKLWKIVSENIMIDKNTICKYYLWDIAVEEKEGLLFERCPEIKNILDEHGMVELSYPCDLNRNSFKQGDNYLVIDNCFSSNSHSAIFRLFFSAKFLADSTHFL